jgi:DNA helicase-2/ATP-dependent DNA helicase PcrA
VGNLANNFSDSWEELSYSQKEAAEWNNGSYLLLAGPGSGKTRVLTCRIARILNLSEGSRFRLLCLTFTNKAADEMRRRIIDFVPTEENRLFIGTFHSFCADILRQHGIHLGIRPNFEIYSQEVDLQAVLFEAEQKVKKEIDTTFTVKALPVIKRLKSLLITPERSSDLFSDKSLGLYIAKVYSAYEEELASMNALDFNSLIQNAYILFIRYPSIAKRFRTVYKYLCIDEFQDTNLAQYNFIRAFKGNDYKNIFVRN